MPVRMRYESQGMVETTATWPVSAMTLQQRARTNRYQVADLVHVELGEEGAVQQGEQGSRRDRVLEMTSRHCQSSSSAAAQRQRHPPYTSA